MATCPSRRATLDSYSPVPTRTGKASRNESKTPARHERSSSIPVRTVRRTPREDENEPLLPRAHGTPSVKKSRRQPCPTPSRIPQRTNALFQNSGCVPLKGRLLSPAPGPFSHPSGTKQNPQKADYNQVFSIVQPTDFKDSSTPTLGCNSLLTSPTFQIPQYLDGPDVPSLFLGDQSFNHLKDSRDDADLVSSATPDLPQADAVTVASLLLDTQSFARLHYSTVKPRTGSNADQEATLTTFHQFTPISSHIEYENNGDEKILCATGPLKYAIQRNGGPNLSSLPSPSFSTPCTAGSTIPNTATSFSPSLSSTTASPTWIPPATMGSPSSFASASISYSGIKPSLTIETMRLGGIDISLAIIKEESEDSPASTIRCRIPTSASSERETLKLLNEFESLAVQMKHLPVPAPVSGSLPRSLEERKIVASGARSNVKTHYRREVSGIGGAHVQGSKSVRICIP